MTTFRQIKSVELIKRHLSFVYRIQPIIEIRCAGAVIGTTRIVYDTTHPDEIVIRASAPTIPKAGVLKLSYFADGFEHHFESEIVKIRSLGAGAILKISRPDTISAINRRNYLRLCPSCQEPLNVTLETAQSGSTRYPVQDISASGFSLLVPFEDDLFACQKEIGFTLDLPDYGNIRAAVTLRNLTKCNVGLRIGVEISSISDENKKKLVDYTVAQTLKNRNPTGIGQESQAPTLCLIYDNENNDDALAYLEQPYRLIRHNINSDWKPMARVSPDVLLFNLNSIDPSTLLSKIRNLANLKQVPAIVIADKQGLDLSCDATVLSQFRDPAALIEAVEQSIPPTNRPSKIVSGSDHLNLEQTQNHGTILILNLKNKNIQKLVEAIEMQQFVVLIIKELKGILDIINKIRPVLIGIYSDVGISIENLLRMMKINKYTKKVPVFFLEDDTENKQTDFQLTNKANIMVFSTNTASVDLARQITAIAHHEKNE